MAAIPSLDPGAAASLGSPYVWQVRTCRRTQLTHWTFYAQVLAAAPPPPCDRDLASHVCLAPRHQTMTSISLVSNGVRKGNGEFTNSHASPSLLATKLRVWRMSLMGTTCARPRCWRAAVTIWAQFAGTV